MQVTSGHDRDNILLVLEVKMKIRYISSLCFPVLLLSVMAAASACTPGDGVTLEDGHNDEYIRVIDIRATSMHKGSDGKTFRPRPFGGYDASALTPEGQLLGAFYQRTGVKMARAPLGWQCDLTLDAVFPNEFADWTSPDSYQSKALNDLEEHLVKYGVLPVWQAAWDLGDGGCAVTPTVGMASRTVGDTEKWAEVSATLAYKLNSLVSKYYDQEMRDRLAGFGLVPGYVEVLPDATGVGGYSIVGPLLPVYRNFVNKLNGQFSADSAKPKIIETIAPGLKVSDPTEFDGDESDIVEFISLFKTTRPKFPDIFSIKPEVASLEQIVDLVKAARSRLDDEGLTDLPLAAFGATLSPEVWEIRQDLPNTVKTRSAYIGAFTAAMYIRLQDELKTIVPARWSTMDMAEENYSGEDLFQNGDGTELPALLMLSMLNTFSEQGEVVIDVPNSDLADPVTVDGDVISVMGAKITGGGYQFLVAALNPAAITVDGKQTARNGHRIKYVLNISDIPNGTTGWGVKIAEVDAGSNRFSFASREGAAVDNGSATISGYITAPAVVYIKFAPPTVGEE
jgi:hypothetical protein